MCACHTHTYTHNKLSHTASFLVKNLGIRHASAMTKRLAVSIAQVASDHDVDANVSYHQVKDLQELIVRKRSSIPGAATLKVFPKDPKDFWVQYPTSYSEAHPPVPCRIDESLVMERNCKSCVPTRSTNLKIGGKPNAKSRLEQQQQQVANPDILGTTMQMMMKFMMGNVGAQPPSFGAQSPSLQHRRALEDRSSSSNLEHEVPNDDGGLPGVPNNAGGIPGALQAPTTTSTPATGKMKKIICGRHRKRENKDWPKNYEDGRK